MRCLSLPVFAPDTTVKRVAMKCDLLLNEAVQVELSINHATFRMSRESAHEMSRQLLEMGCGKTNTLGFQQNID